MTISVQVIEHSLHSMGNRLATLQCRYPKFIHGEVMTHRVFSRSASSSRAVPVLRLIQDVIRDPVTPSFWGRDQRGMQAREALTGEDLALAMHEWKLARELAVGSAQELARIGAHKQIVNRILEPFSHINTLITSTEWDNFFGLRCHPDAQPEMRELANRMQEAVYLGKPKILHPQEWHLPYVTEGEKDRHGRRDLKGILRKLSVARCARVSYLTHELKVPSMEEDLKLYDRLVGSRPLHASPAEHQATPDTLTAYGWNNSRLHGNFKGFIQHRQLIEEMM